MKIEIINEPIRFDLYGFSGIAVNKDYAGTAFRLSGRMWDAVKSQKLANKGLNIWIYEADEKVFAGVELEEIPKQETGLERKNILLPKYAYFKHIGPYHLIQQTGQRMTAELKSNGFEPGLPYIEIYGHWVKDENKLATELIMGL